MRMQNGFPLIIDRSSPGSGLQGGVSHKFSNIYTPPTPPPRLGDAKQIIPLMGDAVALARTRMPGRSPVGGWGWGSCLLNAYAATRGQ